MKIYFYTIPISHSPGNYYTSVFIVRPIIKLYCMSLGPNPSYVNNVTAPLFIVLKLQYPRPSTIAHRCSDIISSRRGLGRRGLGRRGLGRRSLGRRIFNRRSKPYTGDLIHSHFRRTKHTKW